ncbi:magnesium transporter [Spiroplasma endosymbiont of Agriotes lineatus]|uniref:magnesium transporter n=1 Tax=Spiroplasma endosymbiont of Agriotes lineatus TaxID=3077930 RepID=UPI0030D382E9
MSINKSLLQINISNLQKLININDKKSLEKILKNLHSADLADVINKMENLSEVLYLVRLLDSKIASEVFINLDTEIKIMLLNELNNTEITQLVNQLYADDIVELLEQIPEEVVKKLIINASRDKRKEINILLNYEENSAGSIMSVDFVQLLQHDKVGQALKKVKQLGERAENSDKYYVTDNKNKLLGVISLRNLVFANSIEEVNSVMETNVVSVDAHSDQELVANIVQKYDLNEVAVVNKQNVLIGIITVDDILDVMEEEATEDIEKLAAIKPTEMLYLKTPVWRIVRSRIFWLLFLLVSATFSELVIDAFLPLFGANKNNSSNLSNKFLTLLVPLLPIIADTGGNSGSQASTTIVRALSLGDVTVKDYGQVVWKELRISFFVGLILICFNFIRMIVINLIKYDGVLHWDQWASMITISLSLWIIIIISKVAGGILPIIAKLLRLDPVVMAAPLVTTIIDCVSTTIFFSIALLFFVP